MRNMHVCIYVSVVLLFVCPGASAQFRTVTVANSPSQPVPVQPQGTTTVTGSVTISNTPTVTFPSAQNVNVANTPSVTVANAPTVTVGNLTSAPVPVAGTGDVSAAPVITRDNDQPARHAYSRAFTFPVSATGIQVTVSFPGTSELVIEDFSAMATMTSGQVDYFYLQYIVTGATDFLPPALSPSGVALVHTTTRMYIDPGHSYTAAIACNGTCSGSATFSVSGHFVDLP